MQLRFAVGVPNGKRSRVWTLKSHRSDVYAFTRGAGALWKVSMHRAQGDRAPLCTLGVTGEFAEALERDGVLATRADRFFDQWPRTLLPNGALLATRLLIPFESIRERHDSVAENVTWVSPPAENAGVSVSFIFLSAPQGALTLRIPDEQSLLARWELENREVFLAVAGAWPFNDESMSSLAEIREKARMTEAKWVTRPIVPGEEGLAMITGGQQPDGRHMLVDLDYDFE